MEVVIAVAIALAVLLGAGRSVRNYERRIGRRVWR